MFLKSYFISYTIYPKLIIESFMYIIEAVLYVNHGRHASKEIILMKNKKMTCDFDHIYIYMCKFGKHFGYIMITRIA